MLLALMFTSDGSHGSVSCTVENTAGCGRSLHILKHLRPNPTPRVHSENETKYQWLIKPLVTPDILGSATISGPGLDV